MCLFFPCCSDGGRDFTISVRCISIHPLGSITTSLGYRKRFDGYIRPLIWTLYVYIALQRCLFGLWRRFIQRLYKAVYAVPAAGNQRFSPNLDGCVWYLVITFIPLSLYIYIRVVYALWLQQQQTFYGQKIHLISFFLGISIRFHSTCIRWHHSLYGIHSELSFVIAQQKKKKTSISTYKDRDSRKIDVKE